MSLEHFKTQVLLLHSEQRTLDSLSKGFSDRYSVHCATSGTEALNTLGETPIHVLVCAQNMPGMSGLEALREAKKRSPDTIGIILAGSDRSDGLEAMVGEQEVFQIIRGKIKATDLQSLVETATKSVRLMTLSKSANDTKANVDMSTGEHIVMETAENGSMIISDGTGTMPALRPERIQMSPDTRGRNVDVLVLTKDEEFLATIRESSLGLHEIFHANTPRQAEDIIAKKKVGVLVTDAAMVGSNIEVLTKKLRIAVPRLVAIVAGRRDDGELLMDLINRGKVYRFLLKPVSPGRVRLAIEASIKHHLDAADSAFGAKPTSATGPAAKPASIPAPVRKFSAPISPVEKVKKVEKVEKVEKVKKQEPTFSQPMTSNPDPRPQKVEPMRATISNAAPPSPGGLDDAFDGGGSITQTMTDIAASVGKFFSAASRFVSVGARAIVTKSGKTLSGLSGMTGLMKNPKLLAAAGVLIAVAVGTTWIINTDSSDSGATPAAKTSATTTPTTVNAVNNGNASQNPESQVSAPDFLEGDLLQKARDARDAGDIASPAGRNAMEYYVAALSAAPDDQEIATELAGLTEEVFGLAENHLLANRYTEAARALRVVGIADPENARLRFMNVQLNQIQLRNLFDDVREAMRDARFEDARRSLAQAASVAGSNSSEFDALTEQLAIAQYGSVEKAEIGLIAAQEAATREAEADRIAAEAARKAEIDRIAAEEAAAIQAEADRVAAEKAAVLKAEADRLAAEEAVAKKVEADRLAAEVAAAKKAEADRVAAAKKAEADRVAAANKAEADRVAAAKKAEADRVAAEIAAAKKAKADRLAAEAIAAKKAEADRLAAEATAAKKAKADRLAAEATAAKKAEADRLAAEATAAKKAEADRLVAGVAAAKKAEADRLAAEATAAKKAEADRVAAEIAADRKAAAVKAEADRVAAALATAYQTDSVARQKTVSSTANPSIPASATSTRAGSAQADKTADAVARTNPKSTTVANETVSAPSAKPPSQKAPESITAVKRIHYVAPKYPRSAQRRDISGWVDLSFTVNTSGDVADITIMDSEPKTVFDDAATRALSQWRFEPATENNEPVEKQIALRLSFNLQ